MLSELYLRVWLKGKKKSKKEDRSWININSLKYPNLRTQKFKAILKKKKKLPIKVFGVVIGRCLISLVTNALSE